MEQPTASPLEACYGHIQGNANLRHNCSDDPEGKSARRRTAVEKSTSPSGWRRENQFIEN